MRYGAFAEAVARSIVAERGHRARHCPLKAVGLFDAAVRAWEKHRGGDRALCTGQSIASARIADRGKALSRHVSGDVATFQRKLRYKGARDQGDSYDQQADYHASGQPNRPFVCIESRMARAWGVAYRSASKPEPHRP